MNETTCVQVGEQHRRELMREAEQERLAKEARRDGGKRVGPHRGIGPGRARRRADRLLGVLRVGRTKVRKGVLRP